jgi:hypothetical protein
MYAQVVGGCKMGFFFSLFEFISSTELKAQVSFSDRPLSGVHLSVSPSVLLSVRL